MTRDKAQLVVTGAIAEELYLRFGIDYDVNATMDSLGASSLDIASFAVKIESMIGKDLKFEDIDPTKVTVDSIITYLESINE